MHISKHAKNRMKERCGLNKKSKKRMAQRALKEGIAHAQTKGRLNKWITRLYFKNPRANNIRIYGNYAYIFCEETLVTVLPVPVNLIKDMEKMTKKLNLATRELKKEKQ